MGGDGFSKCHPLTNFLYFLCVIGFTAVIQHPAYLALSGAANLGYFLVLKKGTGLKRFFTLLPLLLLVALGNPLMNPRGETVLFTLFSRPYTLEALLYGLVLAGMLGVMLLAFGCYSEILTSDKFICLFGSLLPSLSLLLVMILRLIPAFQRKAVTLSGTRRCIGKGIEDGANWREKLRCTMNLISALTDWALESSIVTADSMRARGYGTAKRTSFRRYRLRRQDVVLLTLMAFLAATVIGAGGMEAEFIPRLCIAPPTWGLLAYGVLLAVPLLLDGKEEIQWRISKSKI